MIHPGGGPISSHPALRALGRRVRVRWLLERSRSGLLAGLAGLILVAVAGRALELVWWPAAAAALLAMAWLGFLVADARRWPDAMAVARAADALGLDERASSALYASGAGHPAAPLLAADANRLLARLDPADYPLVVRPQRWLPVALAFCLAGSAILVPLPMSGDLAARAAEARAVEVARQAVEALRVEAVPLSTPEPLSRSVAEELRALEERVGSTGGAREADRALEKAQERLAALGRPEDFAWQRALEGLSAALAGQEGLSQLASALATQDPAAVERALEDLSSRVGEMTPEERADLQLALQAAANASRGVPELAGALRKAASESGSPSGDPAQAMGDLSSMLAEGAARARGLSASQQALAGVGRARAALGSAASAASGGAQASGAPTGSGQTRQSGSASAGQPGGSASSGSSGRGSASSGQGAGSGSGSGSGSGAGQGQGASGAGGSGSGGGAGAGSGGGPSQGQPGGGSSGATTAGGNASPSMRGSVPYDPVYAPSLLGGSGGPDVQVPGDASSAGGETVELPDSPVALGSVRPYDQVYGEYEAAARQSLSRQPLPPALQGVVQRYFSAIRPADSDE